MHSHRSSICTRQYLNDDICMTIWLYFCCQQQHLLFLVAFANSSLSIIYFSGACIWFDSSFHIQFHAFKFLNEIVQRVSFYINIMHLFFSVSVFFFFFRVLAHVIIFAMGSFLRAHNYWHIYWYNKIIVRYIDQTLFCALFFSMHCGNEKTQHSEQITQNTIWNIEN